jgi:hypothetical protein
MAHKSMAVGGGGRFAALKAKLASKGGVSNPGAVAANIGRNKYGKREFQRMASAGRKKASRVSKRGSR